MNPALTVAALCLLASSAEAAPISWTNPQAVHESEDLSGVVLLGSGGYVVSDEGHVLQHFFESDAGWTLDGKWALPSLKAIDRVAGEDPEIDLEDLAAFPGGLFVVGSHSSKRKKPKQSASVAENRARLAKTKSEPERRVLYSLELGADGAPSALAELDLRKLIEADSVLGPVARTGAPAKEGGIDIEGIAWRADRLFVGFRGPVLRGEWTPVGVVDAEASSMELRFLNLAGRGIRSMEAVADGFLLLTGPVGAGGPFSVVFWDGRDCLVGSDAAGCTVAPLALLPPADGGAEGLALRAESDAAWEVVVIRDGVAGGAPESLVLTKP